MLQRNAWDRWRPILFVSLVTFVVFWPALHNGFVDWDDDKNFIHNLGYRGLSWPHLQWMFTRSATLGVFIPLTWLSNGLDYLLWGMNPLGYHLGNLLIHCANAVVFYLILYQLGGDRGSALFGSLFFSIHPLRVESVAWATERRDVLSAFFILLTIVCYLNYVQEEGQPASRGWSPTGRARGPFDNRPPSLASALSRLARLRRASASSSATSAVARVGRIPPRAEHVVPCGGGWFFKALLAYVLSLLSKASGMTLALVLFWLDFYPARRIGPWATEPRPLGKIILEKLAFLGLALPISGVAAFAAIRAGATASLDLYTPSQRLGLACYGIIFYLKKTLVPVHLSPFYQLPLRVSLRDPPFFFSFLAVLLLTIVVFWARKKWPSVAVSWLIYLTLLIPLTGIFQSGPTRAADHISYLASLPLAALVAGAVRALRPFPISRVFAGMLLAGLAFLSWQQTHIWHDTETLWRQVLAIEPDSAFAHNNLGNDLIQHGKIDEGIEHLQSALRLRPQPEMFYSMGAALQAKGRLKDAVDFYHQALGLKFDRPDLHYSLANALLGLGRTDAAIVQYEAALKGDPSLAYAHNNLGSIFLSRHRYPEAAAHFREAVRLVPGYADAYNNLGVALASQSQWSDAIQSFEEALKLNPSFENAKTNLANIRREAGSRARPQ